MKKSTSSYDNVTIALHWCIGVGIMAIGALEILRHALPKGDLIREGLKPLHQPGGTILFALILIRIVWRLMLATPPDTAARISASTLVAKLTHIVLYVMMVSLPLLGMLSVFARGKPIDFGLFQIAMSLGGIGPYSGLLKSAHETLGYAILALAFVHALAALGHHYIVEDDVLLRMRFTRGRSSGAMPIWRTARLAVSNMLPAQHVSAARCGSGEYGV